MDNWRKDHLITLLTEDPTDEFAQYALAQEYRKEGELDKAIETFESLRQQNPEYVGLYYHLAQTYVDQDKVDKATFIYSTGIEIAKRIGDQHALSELQNALMNIELEE